MKGQLRWMVACAVLALCCGLPAKRDAVYYPGLQSYAQPYVNPYFQPYSQPYAQPYVQPYTQQIQVRSSAAAPQFQRVIVYNQGAPSGVVHSMPASVYRIPPGAGVPAGVPGVPAGGSYLVPLYQPLRADGEAGSGAGGGAGTGSTGSEDTDYLTTISNYWQYITGGSPSGEGAGSAATSESSNKKPEEAKKPEGMAPLTQPMANAETPSSQQRFLVLSQPHVVANPAALRTASNGAVSTYLLMKTPEVAQNTMFRAQPQQPQQQQQQQQQLQQQALPPRAPLVLVRMADNKFGLAPAPVQAASGASPSFVMTGDGVGVSANDDVRVSGPGSQALAFQQFLLTRQAPYHGIPAVHQPGITHSLADESIAVEAVKDSGASSGTTEDGSSATSTTTPASGSNDNDVVDSDSDPPVSIAQVKPQAIALAGVGGVAAAAPVGTALVGPGGMALAAPSATAVAGPSGGTPPIAAPAIANTAFHNADAYRKWLKGKKGNSNDESDFPSVPQYLVEYGAPYGAAAQRLGTI